MSQRRRTILSDQAHAAREPGEEGSWNAFRNATRDEVLEYGVYYEHARPLPLHIHEHMHRAYEDIETMDQAERTDYPPRPLDEWCIRCLLEALWSPTPWTVRCRTNPRVPDGPCQGCTDIALYTDVYASDGPGNPACPCLRLDNDSMQAEWMLFLRGGPTGAVPRDRVRPLHPMTQTPLRGTPTNPNAGTVE